MRRNYSRLLGQPAAGDMNPMYGAVLAGVAGTGATIAARELDKSPELKWRKNDELVGLGVGIATGVALAISPKSRAAGMAGIAVALATNGVRVVRKMMHKDKGGDAGDNSTETLTGGLGVPTAQYRTALGAASAQRVPAFGAASAQRVPSFGGGGLGIVSPEVVRSLGQSPVAFQGGGLGSPVQFQGGMAANYGATLYGGGSGR